MSDITKKKAFLEEKYLCNDKIYRRAFRIKGCSNTIFVMYKRQVTRAKDIPLVLKKRISQKKKKKSGGGDEEDLKTEYETIISTFTVPALSKIDAEMDAEIEYLMNNEIESKIEIEKSQLKEFLSLSKKTFILNALMASKGFIDDYTDYTAYNDYKSQNVSEVKEKPSLYNIQKSNVAAAVGGSDEQNIENGINSMKKTILKMCGRLNAVIPTPEVDTSSTTNILNDEDKNDIKQNIDHSYVQDTIFYNGLQYYYKGFKADENMKKEYIKRDGGFLYKLCSYSNDSSSAIINCRWLNVDSVVHKDEIEAIKKGINATILSLYNCSLPQFTDIILKHLLFCFPEILLIDDLNTNLFFYMLRILRFSREESGRYNKTSNIIPIKYRQFYRGTCWAASVMNMLDVLESKGVKIQNEEWEKCKTTLDVNTFASLIVNKKAINNGYHPPKLWNDNNNFGIEDKHKVEVKDIFLNVAFNLFLNVLKINKGTDTEKENIISLEKLIGTMGKSCACIVSRKSFTYGNHAFVIHKINDETYEIYDSNYARAYTDVKEYLNYIYCNNLTPDLFIFVICVSVAY